MSLAAASPTCSWPVRDVAVDDALDAAAVDGEAGDDARRAAQPRGVVAHGPEGGHGAFGRRVVRQVGGDQLVAAGHDVLAAHEGDQDRFLAA